MKEILDSNTRQVQPIDFSFLSGADKDIVAGIEKLLRTMYGWNEEPKQPIVLTGLIYNTTTKKISSGLLMYNGTIYDVDTKTLQTSILIGTDISEAGSTISTITGNSILANILDSVKIRLIQEVVSPSPVLDKDLSLTINCHVNNKAILTQMALTNDDSAFSYNSLNRVGLMATNDALYALTQRVTTLENTYTLLHNASINQ
jgi:hypothetical protein